MDKKEHLEAASKCTAHDLLVYGHTNKRYNEFEDKWVEIESNTITIKNWHVSYVGESLIIKNLETGQTMTKHHKSSHNLTYINDMLLIGGAYIIIQEHDIYLFEKKLRHRYHI